MTKLPEVSWKPLFPDRDPNAELTRLNSIRNRAYMALLHFATGPDKTREPAAYALLDAFIIADREMVAERMRLSDD